jgi:pyruvate,orthophosphate dikinase
VSQSQEVLDRAKQVLISNYARHSLVMARGQGYLAACGGIVFDADTAEEKAKGGPVILVRYETTPDDIHGMIAAQGILTSRGGKTSHAAVVARGMGKTCVCGASALEIDYSQQQFSVNGEVVTKGEWITVDGSTGRVFLGKVPTIQPTASAEGR